MNILTDEEIDAIVQNHRGNSYDNLARAIEAAVLSKLSEQAGVEHVAYMYPDKTGPLAGKCFVGGAQTGDIPLFTQAQLIAAQQCTAEACAKVIRGEGIGFADDDEELNRIAAMLEAGEWREYL